MNVSRARCIWLSTSLFVGIVSARMASAQPDCERVVMSDLDRAQCAIQRADVDAERNPDRASIAYCEALLLASLPPRDGDSACVRARALARLSRYQEAGAAAAECKAEASSLRTLLQGLPNEATVRLYNYEVSWAFPSSALTTLTVEAADGGGKRTAYCSSISDPARDIREGDFFDSKSFALLLERGQYTLHATWADGSETAETVVFDTEHTAPIEYKFGVITVTSDESSQPAQLTATLQSDTSKTYREQPAQRTTSQLHSLTVPKGTYNVSLEAIGFVPWAQQVEVNTWVTAPRFATLTPIKPSLPRPTTPQPEPQPATPESDSSATLLADFFRSDNPWLYMSVGGAVISAAALGPWLAGNAIVTDLRSQCAKPNSCANFEAKQSDVKVLDLWTNGLLIAGGVTFATAVAFYLAIPKPAANTTIDVGFGAVHISQRWSF